MKRKPSPNATAPAVSRFLGRFADRAEPDTTADPEDRFSLSGFEVWDPKEEGGGKAIVEHQLGEGSHRLTQSGRTRHIENALLKYAGILRIRYDVEVDLEQERLVVTTKEDER